MKTLVITGLFSPLSGAIAQWAVERGIRVLGVDIQPMTRPLSGVEFVRADIRNPLFPQLLKAEQVDAIFHGAFRWRVRRSEEIFESNVMGTVKLLGAATLAGVKKVVFPSSTFVYGAHPRHSSFMSENDRFYGRSRYAYVRELRDIETFLSGFQRQHSEMVFTVLRFANILGRQYPSPLARYLSLPVIPTLMGYDPMIQIIHFDDVVRALIQALEEDHQGVFNVATSPPLPVMKLIRMAGGYSVPILHPFAYTGQSIASLFLKKSKEIPAIPWDFLRYSWTASTDKIAEEWGYHPRLDAERTVQLFAEERHVQGDGRTIQSDAAARASA